MQIPRFVFQALPQAVTRHFQNANSRDETRTGQVVSRPPPPPTPLNPDQRVDLKKAFDKRFNGLIDGLDEPQQREQLAKSVKGTFEFFASKGFDAARFEKFMTHLKDLSSAGATTEGWINGSTFATCGLLFDLAIYRTMKEKLEAQGHDPITVAARLTGGASAAIVFLDGVFTRHLRNGILGTDYAPLDSVSHRNQLVKEMWPVYDQIPKRTAAENKALISRELGRYTDRNEFLTYLSVVLAASGASDDATLYSMAIAEDLGGIPTSGRMGKAIHQDNRDRGLASDANALMRRFPGDPDNQRHLESLLPLEHRGLVTNQIASVVGSLAKIPQTVVSGFLVPKKFLSPENGGISRYATNPTFLQQWSPGFLEPVLRAETSAIAATYAAGNVAVSSFNAAAAYLLNYGGKWAGSDTNPVLKKAVDVVTAGVTGTVKTRGKHPLYTRVITETADFANEYFGPIEELIGSRGQTAQFGLPMPPAHPFDRSRSPSPSPSRSRSPVAGTGAFDTNSQASNSNLVHRQTLQGQSSPSTSTVTERQQRPDSRQKASSPSRDTVIQMYPLNFRPVTTNSATSSSSASVASPSSSQSRPSRSRNRKPV